ncbi:MAG: electron transfer flavoprotein subunit alpha/FixB family protein [Candidatus Hodgkinia cicadicola]
MRGYHPLAKKSQMALKFSKVLVLPEFDKGVLTVESRMVLSLAVKKSTTVDVLAINCDMPTALSIGASKVYVLASNSPTNVRAACVGVSVLLSALSGRYDAILVGGASVYHSSLCRAAGVLNKVVITNVFNIIDDNLFVRSAAGSRINQRIKNLAGYPCLLSINAALLNVEAFRANNETKTLQLLEFSAISKAKFSIASCVKRARTGYKGCPSLSEASVVVAGGGGFKTAHLFNKYLVTFARLINAAVGATRAAVEAGVAPPFCQIGQTGAIISPKIYITFGVSGSSQHMAGVRGAGVIIAINWDVKAPIVRQANFALVADMYNVLPQLINAFTPPEPDDGIV